MNDSLSPKDVIRIPARLNTKILTVFYVYQVGPWSASKQRMSQ